MSEVVDKQFPDRDGAERATAPKGPSEVPAEAEAPPDDEIADDKVRIVKNPSDERA